MRSLVVFLVGLIVGAGVILFLPESRRVELNTQLRPQIDALQLEVRQLGQQLKDIQLPKPNDTAATKPTPTATAAQ